MRFNMVEILSSLNHLRYNQGISETSQIEIKLIDADEYAKEGELLTQSAMQLIHTMEKKDYDDHLVQVTTIIEVFPAGEGRFPRVSQTTCKELKK